MSQQQQEKKIQVYQTETSHVDRYPPSEGAGGDLMNPDFFVKTTSKKKVHQKTRQVETRVSRQLLVEDGKVIADSGPQVITRIKEDNKLEESEKEKTPKYGMGKYDSAIECAPEGKSSGRVLGEKKEIQRVSREVREENMQYHDERFKELSGRDVHQRAIVAPHELITINDEMDSGGANSVPRGKIVHYSNHGKKYEDTDEILEVAKLAIDGSITKEITRKKHHEEFSEDELPDEKGEAEKLRHKPEVVRSSRRGVDYVNDFDDPIGAEAGGERSSSSTGKSGGRRHHQHHHHSATGEQEEEEAFPRYEIDPLLNSLRDEDFKPLTTRSGYSREPQTSAPAAGRSGRYREHRLERKDSSSSEEEEDEELARNRQQHRYTPAYTSAHHNREEVPVVEVPEEYRHHKERLLSGKHGGGGKKSSISGRERSFSPAQKSHLSHRSHKEDASVQAHLTDEEEEKKSMGSSDANSHAKTAKHLQRQSTINSSRNYYYGKQRHRPHSVSSSASSSSLDDPKERLRKQGARSKDSGFKSPTGVRTATPVSRAGKQHEIYSVSSKSKRNRSDVRGGDEEEPRQAVSPTPSAGQRSVKTTTTTMSAGLQDRPLSRGERSTIEQRYGRQNNKSGSATTSKGAKVSKPPSPFQQLKQLFAPSSQKHKQQQQPVATR